MACQWWMQANSTRMRNVAKPWKAMQVPEREQTLKTCLSIGLNSSSALSGLGLVHNEFLC